VITRRYKPEVGDIVIGRVVEVHINNFTWKFIFVLVTVFSLFLFNGCYVGCSEALEIGYKFQSGCSFDAFFYEYA